MRQALSKHGTRWAFGLILTILAIVQSRELPIALIERLDHFIYDWRMQLPTPVMDPRIVIVDIDERSLSEVGRWPWSRDVVAKLLDKLAIQYQAKTIAFDVLFAEPDTSSGYNTLEALGKHELQNVPGFGAQIQALKPMLDYDGRLAKAMQDRPVVLAFTLSNQVGAQAKGLLPAPAFTETDLDGRSLDATTWKAYAANLAQLQRAATAAGFDNPIIDPDGTIRSVPLLAQVGDNYYESLSLATARVALGATGLRPVFLRPDKIFLPEVLRRQYGTAAAIALNTVPHETGILVEPKLSARVQFRGKGGPEGGAFRYVSAVDVLKGRLASTDLTQRIILIGTTVPGLYDLRSTPVSPNFPGVEIHANLIASILDGKLKREPDFGVAINLLQITLIGTLLAIALPKLKPLPSILLALSTTVVVGAFNFWMYQSFNYVLLVATALLLILELSFFNLATGYLFEHRRRHAIARRFGEYVAPELVEEMAEDPELYNMEGESRELTVLFVDVRDFTTTSEHLSPKALREYINIYLTKMSEDIRGNRGTLDKYIGDAIMAFWGAPVTLLDHATRSVATALLMQNSARALNLDFLQRGMPALKIGIGINTGQMHVGDMGSKIRRAYTVMGDAVNLSSRLEGLTKVYGVGIMVSESTMLAAPEFAYRELDRVRVKGKNVAVPVFEPLALVDALDANRRRTLAQWHAALDLVRAMDWNRAQQIIEELHRAYPDDGLYSLYIQRIAYYRQKPPPADWDGATTFNRK